MGPACPAGLQLALLVQLAFSLPSFPAGLQLALLAQVAYIWPTVSLLLAQMAYIVGPVRSPGLQLAPVTQLFSGSL